MFVLKKRITILCSLFLFMILVPLLAVAKGEKNFILSSESKPENVILREKKLPKTNSCFCVLDESKNEIINIPDEEFLCGAVSAEMPAAFEKEAIKAQAVASYTYFCRARNNHINSSKDEKNYEFTIDSQNGKNYISENQRRQKWGENFEKYNEKIKSAVKEVFGEVVEKKGDLILAAYHAISSGVTEKSEDVFGGNLDYLKNVESPGDKLASGYESEVKISCDDFKSKIKSNSPDSLLDGDPSKWIGEFEKTDGGMIKKIIIGGAEFKGPDIRKIFGLRSSDFSIIYDSEEKIFIFKVYGYGHGVGMSQCGAQYMAKQGSDYRQILSWYYPDTTIEKLF